jgi:hypothetical protein
VSGYFMMASFALLGIVEWHFDNFGPAIFAFAVVQFLVLVAMCGGLN